MLLVVGIVELDVDDGEIEQIVAVVFDDVGELHRITLLQTRNKQNKERKYSSWLRRLIVAPTSTPVHFN